MKKMVFWLLLACLSTFALENWTGWKDTLAVRDTLDSATAYYTNPTLLSQYENIRLIVLCDDTAEAGFSGDSVNFRYGYQTGAKVLDTNSQTLYTIVDTAWDDRIVLDTFTVDSFGVAHVGTYGSDGTLTRTWKNVDTTYVSGYAYQSRNFSPEWDLFIRFWVESLGGANADGKALRLFLVPIRRVYSNTRGM